MKRMGQDYPLGFVRWTEQRNFEAVLDMMASGRLDVKPLISHRFAIDEAEKAYEVVAQAAPSLGILLEYPTVEEKPDKILRHSTVSLLTDPQLSGHAKRDTAVVVAFIGAGNYATAVLIPAFKAAGVRFKVVASSGGVSALHAGRKFGFEEATTDTDSIFADPQVNAVVIATRHDNHARLVCQALRAGKHVFVEKPLALTLDELAEIEHVYAEVRAATPVSTRGDGMPLLMVGFNRRFAPQVKKIKSLLERVKGPKAFVMTVNAGAIPSNHWTHDPGVGGGRVLGEALPFRRSAPFPCGGFDRST